MKIERHAIDEPYFKDMKERAIRNFSDLPESLDATKRDPSNFGSFIGRCKSVIGYCSIADPKSPHIPIALRCGAEASAALFVVASAPPGSVTVQLDGKPVTYMTRPDESIVEVGKWITGFYLNVICGNLEGIRLLCETPVDLLRGSTTKGGEYLYLYMQALQLFGRGESKGIVEKMLAAVKATDPDRPDVIDPDWTLYLHVPQLELLIYAVTRDAKFEPALTKAVELHKKFWSKSKDRRCNYEGYVSLELTGLAAIGRDRKLPFDVESPYLPMHLVKL